MADHLASVAASTYDHYLWCDLSLLFNCPVGVDRVAIHYAFRDETKVMCLFNWSLPEEWMKEPHFGYIVYLPTTQLIRDEWAAARQRARDYEAQFKTKKVRATPTDQAGLRNHLALCAYAYEFEDDSLIDDHTFDALCLTVDPRIVTKDAELDAFWLTEFQPCTGLWVRDYPQLSNLREQYANLQRQ